MGPIIPIALSFVCFQISALLVLIPNTSIPRLALLPVTLCLAYQAMISFDVVEAYGDPRLHWISYIIGCVMLTVAMKVTEWTFCYEPLRRVSSGSSSPEPRTIGTLFKDSIILVASPRGLGWTWSKHYRPPRFTRPTSSTPRFLLYTFTSGLVHWVIGDLFFYIVQSSDWDNLTDPSGASLFNPRLAPVPRYLLSSFNSALIGLLLYCGLQTFYDIFTLVGVMLFGYSPLDWPPIFDSPWQATSLVDFWAARWHQLFRRSFVQLGIKPLTLVVGRQSGLASLGGFIVSGLLHEWALLGLDKRIGFSWVSGYFFMQGVGVVLESVLVRRLLGGKVDGWKGWVWTVCWTVGWGNMMVDVWCRRGIAASLFMPEKYRPSLAVVDAVVWVCSKYR